MTEFVDLDVRPALRAGEEPFEQIMATVSTLSPDKGLRLLATFKPTPLLHVLGSRGFTHELRELAGGDWEVTFSPPAATAEGPVAPAPAPQMANGEWPSPGRSLDNRDLDPPEPMVRVLAALEEMGTGEVLEALLCREPVFLLPELESRGHQWRGAFDADGTTYRILIRTGAGKESAA